MFLALWLTFDPHSFGYTPRRERAIVRFQRLPDVLAPRFAGGGSIDSNAAREQAVRQLGAKGLELSSSALENATKQGSAETFALVRPSATNGHRGVYLYLDEVGLLKSLPANARADGLAIAAPPGAADQCECAGEHALAHEACDRVGPLLLTAAAAGAACFASSDASASLTTFAPGSSTHALPSCAVHVSAMDAGVSAKLFTFQWPNALLVSAPTSHSPPGV